MAVAARKNFTRPPESAKLQNRCDKLYIHPQFKEDYRPFWCMQSQLVCYISGQQVEGVKTCETDRQLLLIPKQLQNETIGQE